MMCRQGLREARHPPLRVESAMAGRECYHCKQWVEGRGARLLDDHRGGADAGSVRGPAGGLGAAARDRRRVRRAADLRVPQLDHVLAQVLLLLRPAEEGLPRSLRVLGRALKAPQVHRVERASKSKVAHIIQIRHRDEVEPPITDWLQEAYEPPNRRVAGLRSGRTRSKQKTDHESEDRT